MNRYYESGRLTPRERRWLDLLNSMVPGLRKHLGEGFVLHPFMLEPGLGSMFAVVVMPVHRLCAKVEVPEEMLGRSTEKRRRLVMEYVWLEVKAAKMDLENAEIEA